jgi:hypothetical protein
MKKFLFPVLFKHLAFLNTPTAKLSHIKPYKTMGRDSSVGIGTDYAMDGRGQTPDGGKRVLSSP